MVGLAERTTALGAHLQSWRYAEGGARDRRLDFLRGYCVFAMAVDHLGANSWLALLTGGNRFLVSAAEGFLFLSGLVMGIVYRPLVSREGLRAATGKALRRALLIYALTVAATLGFMALSAGLGLPWGEGANPLAAAPAVAELRQTFYLTDVLMLYTVLIAAAPLALALLRARLTWLLLALSWGIWGVHQLHPIDLPWPSEAGAFYYIAAWQVLFATGLAIGWHRDRLAVGFGRVGSARVLAGSGVGLAILIALWAWASGRLGAIDPVTAGRVWNDFAKWNLPAPRLVACGVVFAFAFSLVDLCWGLLTRLTGRFLLPLGQAALAAYVVHLIAVGLLTAVGEHLAGGDGLTRAQTTLLQATALAAVWMGVRLWTGSRGRRAIPGARPSGPAVEGPAVPPRRGRPASGRRVPAAGAPGN
jgi:hypothetical protein